jgi:hypothetical protein
MLALAAFSALAAAATAAHWPQFGGDAGRSGYQPLATTGLPVLSEWSKTAGTEQPVRTSIVVTAGNTIARQRVVYGTQGADQTAGGRIHLQKLIDGAPVGAEQGVNLDQGGTFDGDTFGAIADNESVSPVDTSSGSAFGNIFAVHNDDNQDFAGTTDRRRGSDIALAQVLVETGTKALGGISDTGEVALGDNQTPINPDGSLRPNTIGFEIQSSPLITPPDADGTRSIYFTASRASDDLTAEQICDSVDITRSFEDPPDEAHPLESCYINAAQRLFRVDIADAGEPSAEVTGFAMSGDIAGLQTKLSPALARLKNADGEVEDHILLPTATGTGGATVMIKAYKGSTLTETASTADLGDAVVSAPAVPVRSDGALPAETPYFFVAVGDTGAGTGAADDDTWVYRISQNPDNAASLTFDPATGQSVDLPGQPTLGIAVTKLADKPGVGGRVLVLTTPTGSNPATTNSGVYSLNADNLRSVVQQLGVSAVDQDRAMPVASGDLLFYQLDNGDQVVRTIDSLDEVPSDAGGFQENPANDPAGTNTSIGQAAISNRFVVFGSDNGAFAYKATNNDPPPGSAGPAYAVGDSTVTEGNSGETLMTFKVTKFGPGTGTVKLSTSDGTAKAGSDYIAVTDQVVSFGPGQTEKNVSVTVLAESVDENDETFFVDLSEPTGENSAIIDAQGVGVIVSDDDRKTAPGEPRPLIGVSDVVGVEGGNAVFTIALSNASSNPVTVDFATADDTAKAGLDYGGGSGKLTFTPGQVVKTVAVPLVADAVKENVANIERFFMNLANATNASFSDNQGSAFIMERGYDLPRVAPRIKSSTKPKKDTAAPFRFVTSGRLTMPSGVSRANGCKGKVTVQIKAAPAKTISSRRVSVRSNCRFSSTVSFKNAKRFPKNGRLEVHTRFAGNEVLLAKRAKKQIVRTK